MNISAILAGLAIQLILAQVIGTGFDAKFFKNKQISLVEKSGNVLSNKDEKREKIRGESEDDQDEDEDSNSKESELNEPVEEEEPDEIDEELEVEPDEDLEVEEEEASSEATQEVEIEADNNKFKIKVKNRTGEFEAETESVGAISSFPLSVGPNNELIVTTPGGTKIVTVLPEQAVANLLRFRYMSRVRSTQAVPAPGLTGESTPSGLRKREQVQEIELEENGGKLTYKVEGEKKVKLAGFLGINVPITAHVSAATGDIVSVTRPLYFTLFPFLFSE